MKLNLFVTLLSCVYTYYTNAQGQASVYFCRTGGTDGVYEIRTHSASIGMSVPGTYLVFKGEPGTYTFTAQIAGMVNSITMELREGQNYFVETIVKFKQEKRVPSFREFSLKEARSALNRMEKGLGEKLLTEIYNSAPQDDPAIVYFYRNDDSSVDIPFEIKTDSASAGVSVPKTYITYTAKPGTEVFKAQIAGRESSKTIDLKAGLTYFIRCYTFEEGGARYPGFQQVGKEKARQDLNRIEATLGTKLVKEELIETNIDEAKRITSQPDGTQFGFKSGLNLSIFSTSINSDASMKPGFHLGLYMRTKISNKFWFRPEVYFSAQGQKDNYVTFNGSSSGTTTTSVNYINVPLLFEAGGKLKLQFGPQFGFLLSAKEKGTIDGDAVNDDLKDVMKKSDVSLAFGLGFDPAKNVNLGVRYNLGLTQIFDVPDGVDFPKVSNRVFHFYVAFSLTK